MKILAYNINKSTQEKLDKVLLMEADVFILPEVACPSMVQLPEGFEMVWTGDIDQKGLGVIWKSELKAIVPEWFNPEHRYFLPLLVEDKLIMAAWPTMIEQNKPKHYPQILMEALKEYNIRVPEDISVIGCDDHILAGYVTPGLTTIRTHMEELGVEAAKEVFRLMAEKEGRIRRLPGDIVVRRSCGIRERSEGKDEST